MTGNRLLAVAERMTPPPLRYHLRRATSFGLVGFINLATDFIVFFCLIAMGAHPVGANIGSFLASNVQSYVLNSTVTFREDGKRAPLSLRRYAKFWVVHLAGAAASTLIIYLGVTFVDAKDGVEMLVLLPVKAFAVITAFVCNYTLSTLFVFQRKPQDPS